MVSSESFLQRGQYGSLSSPGEKNDHVPTVQLGNADSSEGTNKGRIMDQHLSVSGVSLSVQISKLTEGQPGLELHLI
jgi:hypothetical protein